MNELILNTEFDKSLAVSAPLIDDAKSYIKNSFSKNTLKFYAIDWKIFFNWCESNKLSPLPASSEAICLFLTDQTINHNKAPATLIRRLAAIRLAHLSEGHQSQTKHPTVLRVMRGIRRTTKHEVKKKSSATVDRIEAMIEHCPNTITGLRDKALLLLGFAGAFRRSELVALTFKDIERTDDGIKVIIRRSKTDQEGKGYTLAIPNGTRLRIVDALFHWLKAANITEGYLFRPIRKGGKVQQSALSDRAVANLVKFYAGKAGLNVDKFGGHSLRAGFITSAAKAGASIIKMMEVSRHTNINILSGYIRNENLFENHAGEKFL